MIKSTEKYIGKGKNMGNIGGVGMVGNIAAQTPYGRGV